MKKTSLPNNTGAVSFAAADTLFEAVYLPDDAQSPTPPLTTKKTTVDSNEQLQDCTTTTSDNGDDHDNCDKIPDIECCDSGNTSSNCSSVDATSRATSRTRAETIDSDLPHGFLEADNSNDSNRSSRTDKATNKKPKRKSGVKKPPSSRSFAPAGGANGAATEGDIASQSSGSKSSALLLHAQWIRQQWIWITKKIRDFVLRGVIAIAMVAARHPRKTLVGISIFSFAIVAIGFFTNFSVRLDNEKVFTPADSEVNEFSKFLGNTRMYEPQNPGRRRHLLVEPTAQQLLRSRNLQTTFNFLPEDVEVTVTNTLNTGRVSAEAATTESPTEAPTANNQTEASDAAPTSGLLDVFSFETDAPAYPKTDTPVETEAPTIIETEAPTNATTDDAEETNDNVLAQSGTGTFFPILIHANFQNIFSIEGVHRLFDVVEYIQAAPFYERMCGDQGEEHQSYKDIYGQYTCEFKAFTRFWNHNRTLFEQEVKTEEDLFNVADRIFYPDGGFVDLPFVLAGKEDDAMGRPNKAQAFYGWLYLKRAEYDMDLTDRLLEMREEWAEDDTIFLLEFAAVTSFEREVKRVILGDMPLCVVVFFVMCFFTCMVFFKWHRVYSRTLLGIGAVLTIFFSLITGFGLLFICGKSSWSCVFVVDFLSRCSLSVSVPVTATGIPMTMMTNLLVFIIVGVGLDDTFIITGAYFRTGHHGDAVERIEQTMEAVGSSILLTSITTAMAFILGCGSTILPIRWLCLYAFPTILIDFIYQITFFVALLVLDEQRILDNRMDCCTCIRVKLDGELTSRDSSDEERTCVETPTSVAEQRLVAEGTKRHGFDNTPTTPEFEPQASLNLEELEYETDHDTNEKKRETYEDRHHGHHSPYVEEHFADRIMRSFATKLMHPVVKAVVLVGFAGFAAFCAYRTSMLKQKFNFKDLLPEGSYVSDYVTAIETYSDRAFALKVQFRFVDHSDPEIRDQMWQYVEDLIENVDALNEEPPLCWVREFKRYVSANETLSQLPFYEQLGILLSDPAIMDAFGKDFQFRDDGTILTSMCRLYVTDLDLDNVQDQIKLMRQQREVTANQPINKGSGPWAFFTHDLLFHIFAFYEVAVGELISTTISSVITVCIIAFIFIPHWSAVPIIAPVISTLYIEMLGVLQLFGYSINVITYMILVMSIGLLVDFIMHVLLRYYESEFPTRDEKVKDALATMGSSILVGGMSTFLGTVPLIFSTSEIFSTVCLAFLTMVFLGITHGLILLPVILSYVGTEETISHRKRISILELTTTLSHQLQQSITNLSPRKRLSQSREFEHAPNAPTVNGQETEIEIRHGTEVDI